MFSEPDFLPFNLLEALLKYFESGESQYVTIDLEGKETTVKFSSDISAGGNVLYESTIDYAKEFIAQLEESFNSNPIYSSLTDNEDYNELVKLINNIKIHIRRQENPFIGFLESKFEQIINPDIDDDIRDKYFKEFEELNTTTSSIYDLGDLSVLIILKDGTNLTRWSDIEDKKDVLYVSEDLSDRMHVAHEYANLESLKSAIVKGITHEVKDVSSMFCDCHSLEYVFGFDSWNFSNIKKMDCMFMNCSLLSDISFLKSFDVSNVTDMMAVFQNCISLTDLSPLKSWNVSNVENMHAIFCICSNLAGLNGLESWDVSNVKKMESMFHECRSLADISQLANWKPDNVENLYEMFRDCYSLRDCEALNGWNIKSNVNMIDMFKYCENVQKPEWYFDSTSKVEEYIKGIDDEEKLIDIAYNDSDYIARKFAAYYISDEDVLKDLIQKGSGMGVLEAAVKNKSLNDDEFLFEQFNRDDLSEAYKYFLIEGISDESYLARIAQNDYALCFRMQAINMISDKSVLEDISRDDDNMSVCNFALKRLENL
ncbi:BspA family leucine-rich repeat surface protein [Methanobrevibacter millerae]|uniref:Surface protein n=1 Tax=Methanobrevibacter millerae TaxID=230361 RepID=A0A1G5VT98_9EURY|nr:BspA family leucine-rich repeat surface protein [Methanobrevibacter millerae]SDA49131.1 protein of unknown function, DUF285 [Methanobrevibacter millerae]